MQLSTFTSTLYSDEWRLVIRSETQAICLVNLFKHFWLRLRSCLCFPGMILSRTIVCFRTLGRNFGLA